MRFSALFLMASSIPDPWIVNYLIDIAEEYGANLAAVPRREKAMKAQLVKVMCFPQMRSRRESPVYAEATPCG